MTIRTSLLSFLLLGILSLKGQNLVSYNEDELLRSVKIDVLDSLVSSDSLQLWKTGRLKLQRFNQYVIAQIGSCHSPNSQRLVQQRLQQDYEKIVQLATLYDSLRTRSYLVAKQAINELIKRYEIQENIVAIEADSLIYQSPNNPAIDCTSRLLDYLKNEGGYTTVQNLYNRTIGSDVYFKTRMEELIVELATQKNRPQ